jgi:hypothetical protein
MEDSQPAQKSGRDVKKKNMNSNTSVMYIRVCWVGRGNKMHAHRERPEWGSVYARNEAMKDIFGRCHEKTAVQVCTLLLCMVIL